MTIKKIINKLDTKIIWNKMWKNKCKNWAFMLLRVQKYVHYF